MITKIVFPNTNFAYSGKTFNKKHKMGLGQSQVTHCPIMFFWLIFTFMYQTVFAFQGPAEFLFSQSSNRRDITYDQPQLTQKKIVS